MAKNLQIIRFGGLDLIFSCSTSANGQEPIFSPDVATKAEEIKGATDVTRLYLSTEEGELRRVRLDEVIDCT